MSKKCKLCGAVAEDDAKFCGVCGTSLGEPEAPAVIQPEIVDVEIIQPPRQSFDGVGADARDIRERLVGTKTEYYLPRFETMETLNSFTSWNWASFLFGPSWMVYRKMYAFGIGLWVITQVMNLIGLPLLTLAVWIGEGVLGNYLYMKDINNRTDKAMNLQPEEREVYIGKNAGTSWVPVILLFAVSTVIGAAML